MEAKTTAPPLSRADRRFSPRLGHLELGDYLVYVAVLLVFVGFAITLEDRGFLTTFNLENIVRQAVPIAIMAMAAVFVLSAGEIDLSIGSVVAVAALVSAIVTRDAGVVLGVLAGLGTGVGIGLFNGLVITRIRIPSFLVTLATFELIAGLARMLTDLESVPITSQTYVDMLGGGSIGPVDSLVLWGLGVLVVATVLYYAVRFGAHVRTTGDNRAAAMTAGIRTDRIRVAVFALSGGTAALAGMLYAGRLEGARYSLGENDLLLVFAATIIGGTSLFGGRGSIGGALVGALLLAMLNNGLILFGLSVAEQRFALGGILLLAIALSMRERRQ